MGDDEVIASISAEQLGLLQEWLGDWQLVANHSWPLQDTTVMHVRNAVGDHIVKASLTSHHIKRELEAHQQFLGRLGIPGPRLEHGCVAAGIMVTGYLHGELVQGTPLEYDPEVYRQAGVILRGLQVPGTLSNDYIDEAAAEARLRLDQARGLVPESQIAALGKVLDGLRPFPVRLHFTHGDYQPRNWLHHRGDVSVIDFGRALQRSWVSDLVRLRNAQFIGRPNLESAFMHGMHRTLTKTDIAALEVETIRDSVGTVVWSHRIGDTEFEEHGRKMVSRILRRKHP